MSTATTRLRTLVVLLLTVTGLTAQTGALAQRQRPVSSSLLLLIDASGSMGNAVGTGNPQIKIDAARRATRTSRAAATAATRDTREYYVAVATTVEEMCHGRNQQ